MEASSAPDATDAAAKLAAEKGVDLATVTGTGADGKITVADVEKAAGNGDEGPVDAAGRPTI